MNFASNISGATGILKKPTAAFPQPGKEIEISLKHWQKDWMKLHELKKAELKKFSDDIEKIQRKSAKNILVKPPRIKPVGSPPRDLKSPEYGEGSFIYEMIIGDKARVFFELTNEKEALVYLMRVDPHHKTFPCK